MRCSERRHHIVVAIDAPGGRRRYWVVRRMNPLMNPQADKILKEMQNTLDKWKNNSQVAMTLLTEQMAQLLVVISEEQERSSVRLQRQTRWLISLTWAIVGLTAGLLFFTIVLYKDTHTLI